MISFFTFVLFEKNKIVGAYYPDYLKDNSSSRAEITLCRSLMVSLIIMYVISVFGCWGHFAILIRLDLLLKIFTLKIK